MYTWRLKRAWLPIIYDEPFGGSCWLQWYWEGSRTVAVHTKHGVHMTEVLKRWPAYKYQKGNRPNEHIKVFVDDPDKHFIDSRIADSELFDLNRKEW